MRLLMTIYFCLVIFSVNAENLGPVEYHLPGKAWKVAHELETATGVTIIYTRDNQPLEGAKEFFGVNTNKISFDPVNAGIFKENLQKQFLNNVVETEILERDKDSVLLEWSVSSAGTEVIHSWSRAFATDKGTVALSYQVFGEPSLIQQGRNEWLPILKSAHIKQEG